MKLREFAPHSSTVSRSIANADAAVAVTVASVLVAVTSPVTMTASMQHGWSSFETVVTNSGKSGSKDFKKP